MLIFNSIKNLNMKLRNIITGSLLGLFALTSCSKDDIASIDESQIKNVSDFTDPRDGKTYHCVQIGNQIWMVENLAYFLPGGVSEGCYTWEQEYFSLEDFEFSKSAFSEVYNKLTDNPEYAGYKGYLSYYTSGRYTQQKFIDLLAYWPDFQTALLNAMEEYKTNLPITDFEKAEKSNGNYSKKYGYLYSLTGARKAVPDGWRIPSDADWMKLESILGMSDSELTETNAWRGEGCGTHLKEGGAALFNAKMGGCDAYSAVSYEWIRLEECGYYWTNEEWETEVTGSTSNSSNDSSENDGDSEDDKETAQSVVKEGIIRQVAIFSNRIWRGTTFLNNKDRDVAYSVRCVKDVN